MRALAIALLLLLAPVLAMAQTAIRPDQICPGGVCATPDITWGPNAAGTGYAIGSTVPWRTIATTPIVATDFLATDSARVVELTNTGAITATLPATTGSFGDGFGFTIQVKSGTLTLNPTGANQINGKSSIKVGAYQAVALASRGGNWYATFSIPQPPTQTGTTVLYDNMTWAAAGTGPPPPGGIAFVQDLATGSGVTGVASVAVTLPSTVAGNLFVAVVHGYYGAFVVSGTTVVTNNGTLCNHSPGTLIIGTGTNTEFTDIWYCPNNAVLGSVQFTATFTSNVSNQVNYPAITVAEFSGASTSAVDAGVGAGADRTTASTSQSITTSGSVTQIGDLVVSGLSPATAAATGVGAGQTVFPHDADASYQITTAAGSVTHSFTLTSQQATLSIAAFKHP